MEPALQPVALVTGASSGIGRAVAVALSDRGYLVVLAGRNVAALYETATMLVGDFEIVVADMTDARQVQAMVGTALTEFGRVDVLVNAAGKLVAGMIGEHGASEIEDVVAVNTVGPAIAIARLWPALVRQGSGCIVNISSSATLKDIGGPLAYTASKSALDMITETCAREGKARGIRAFSVSPGPVETCMLRSCADEAKVPRARALAPAQVAAVVVDAVQGRWNSRNGGTILVTWHHPRGERQRLLLGAARRARSAMHNLVMRRATAVQRRSEDSAR